MAKKKVEIPVITGSIDLGPSTELPTESMLNISGWNFVRIHRHYDPLMQWWGNINSFIMSKLILSYDDKPSAWKYELFKIAQKQYDKYGDYYRILDNSFGKPGADDIYETLEK